MAGAGGRDKQEERIVTHALASRTLRDTRTRSIEPRKIEQQRVTHAASMASCRYLGRAVDALVHRHPFPPPAAATAHAVANRSPCRPPLPTTTSTVASCAASRRRARPVAVRRRRNVVVGVRGPDTVQPFHQPGLQAILVRAPRGARVPLDDDRALLAADDNRRLRPTRRGHYLSHRIAHSQVLLWEEQAGDKYAARGRRTAGRGRVDNF